MCCDTPTTGTAFLVDRNYVILGGLGRHTRQSHCSLGSLHLRSSSITCCLHRVTGKTAGFQVLQSSGARELCNFNELVSDHCLSGPCTSDGPGWVPGSGWQAPGIFGEVGLHAVGRGGRRVWQTLPIGCSREGWAKLHIWGIGKATFRDRRGCPPPQRDPLLFQGWLGWAVELACVQEGKQA